MIYIVLWLLAIVTANYTTAAFGAAMSVLNSFLLIGLMLTTRDKLHVQWEGRGLKWKMLCLLIVGAALSYATQPSTGSVATASVAAFFISETIDTLVFHRTKSINKSNIAAAFADSLIFPILAFGSFLPLIFAGQFLAKTCGGYAWSILLKKRTFAVTFVLLAAGYTSANAANFNLQTYCVNGNRASTVEMASRDVFAFVDNSSDLTYGEIVFVPKVLSVNPTVQMEFGDGKLFSINEVILFGVDWNGLQLLYRTDGKPQITYTWFTTYGKFQFTGFIDGTKNSVIAQPQAWYSVTKNISVGSEVQVFDAAVVPYAGIKMSF